MKTLSPPDLTQHDDVPRIASQAEFNPRQRFFRVTTFFLKVILHIYFWDVFVSRVGLLRWYAQRTATKRWSRLAAQFRLLALELGGIHIKLGQFLSARADIVPDTVRKELAGLQDEVPAAPFEEVRERIVAELGRPIEEVFARFDPQAVAAASLGQVYFGQLYNGREVAIKVQRLHIEEIIEVDLSALNWVIRLIKDIKPSAAAPICKPCLMSLGASSASSWTTPKKHAVPNCSGPTSPTCPAYMCQSQSPN